jgi:hypothetical protein
VSVDPDQLGIEPIGEDLGRRLDAPPSLQVACCAD